jgi:Fic family protein
MHKFIPGHWQLFFLYDGQSELEAVPRASANHYLLNETMAMSEKCNIFWTFNASPCVLFVRCMRACFTVVAADPGEFRRSQNWIGGTRPGNALFVPPPPAELDACLGALERFMHEEQSRLPALIKAGLIHVQFETIHPFFDGNGPIGRLLVTLYLCVKGVLRKPLLYLSLYLKTHRADYYRLLQEVRERGAWEAWLEFFLSGVADTANQAFEAATRIVELFKQDRERITLKSERVGSALRVHELLQLYPFVTANTLVKWTGLSAPTINAALSDLERLGDRRGGDRAKAWSGIQLS